MEGGGCAGPQGPRGLCSGGLRRAALAAPWLSSQPSLAVLPELPLSPHSEEEAGLAQTRPRADTRCEARAEWQPALHQGAAESDLPQVGGSGLVLPGLGSMAFPPWAQCNPQSSRHPGSPFSAFPGTGVGDPLGTSAPLPGVGLGAVLRRGCCPQVCLVPQQGWVPPKTTLQAWPIPAHTGWPFLCPRAWQALPGSPSRGPCVRGEGRGSTAEKQHLPLDLLWALTLAPHAWKTLLV